MEYRKFGNTDLALSTITYEDLSFINFALDETG